MSESETLISTGSKSNRGEEASKIVGQMHQEAWASPGKQPMAGDVGGVVWPPVCRGCCNKGQWLVLVVWRATDSS